MFSMWIASSRSKRCRRAVPHNAPFRPPSAGATPTEDRRGHPPIRILIVDDSAVIRRLVTGVIETDPRLEVVSTAPNGVIALQKVAQFRPDLVILDVEMPELDGLGALVEIRKQWPTLPVIMFSTLTERGAATTLEALTRGATDYVTKPTSLGSADLARERVREQLVPKIIAFCRRPGPPAAITFCGPAPLAGTTLPPPRLPQPRQVRAARPVEALVIGVSTGGPNALATLLPRLDARFPVPILVVQHMPPMFTRLMAERLDATCPLQVAEAIEGSVVEPGRIWIAPGDFHMLPRRDGKRVVLTLTTSPQENSCRPSVDPLFAAAASIYGAGTLGLILTGMGQDGLRGAGEIRKAGGRIIVQDEASSVVWGMPGAVVRAGLADAVVSLDNIVAQLALAVAPSLPASQGPMASTRTDRSLHAH